MLDSTNHSIAEIQTDLHKAISAIETIILGKSTQVKLAVCCLIARGQWTRAKTKPAVGASLLAIR